MDSVRVEIDRDPDPTNRVQYCDPNLDDHMNSQRRTSPICVSSCLDSAQPSLESDPQISMDKLRFTAAPTNGISSTSPRSSINTFQYVDDFSRASQQYSQPTGWHFHDDSVFGRDMQFYSDYRQNSPETEIAQSNGNPDHNECKDQRNSDKTPMCLVADLCRYNGVPHQYKLINEGGPAHQKIFTVSLMVGNGNNEEEYTAHGASIKKAQHAAAEKALEETKLPKRPQRFIHKRRPTATTCGYSSAENVSLTPTVMLNALAMKLGMTPEYTFLNSQYPIYAPHPTLPPPSIFHHGLPSRLFRGGLPFPMPPPIPPYNFFRYPPPFAMARIPATFLHVVKLKIGDYEFLGQGHNRQLAKHDASLKALRVLEPLAKRNEEKEKVTSKKIDLLKPSATPQLENNKPDIAPETLGVEKANELEKMENPMDNKSPINMVHEFALQRRLNVEFQVVSEEGLPHLRHFVVRCIITGPTILSLTTEGEGANKKAAKQEAAQKMVKKLKECSHQLPTIIPLRQRENVQMVMPKEKRRKQTIIKNMKSDPNYGQEINPISRLIQVQQAKGEAEPIFEFVREDGHARSKEFVMKVTVGENACEGHGPNKKLAKRAAAEAMLEKMGYAKPLPTPKKPVLKHRQSSSPACEEDPNTDEQPLKPESVSSENECKESSASPEKTRKVKFQLSDETNANRDCGLDEDGSRGSHYRSGRRRSGRRLAPGLLFVPSAFADCDKEDNAADHSNGGSQTSNGFGTWNAMQTDSCNSTTPPAPENAKEQLGYLAQLLSLQVQFTDFPKSFRNGESGDYLSLVSVSTNPPLVCHGSGPTMQHAQNEASLAALRSLASRGLEMAIEAEESMTNGSAVGLPSKDVGSAGREESGGVVEIDSGSEKA